MTKPMIRIHNAQTDEIIDREMTDSEYTDHLKELDKRAQFQSEIDAKKEARNALLERLGITEEEAKLLLS